MIVAVMILSFLALAPAALRLTISAVATLMAARSWAIQRRYADALATAGRCDRGIGSACRRTRRHERRLLAASLRSTMEISCLTSLLPEEAARGARLAQWGWRQR